MIKSCPHHLIEPALDKWMECHWHLHNMETNYHEPDVFRYALNGFLCAFNSVPCILEKTKLYQRNIKAREEIKPEVQALRSTDLYKLLTKKRNFSVHTGMLKLESRGSAGTIEGSRIKISNQFPVSPYESSEEAYVRYKKICRANKIMRGLIGPDCDSAPAIWRTWIIKDFPGRDLLDVAFEAWTRLGELLSVTIVANGGETLDLSMPCRHDPKTIRIKVFSQRDFFLEVDEIDLEEVERSEKMDVKS